jgi:WD40 repeat protein
MSYEQRGLILPEPENRLALVIGVNSAPNARTPLLKTELQASNDAIALAQVLEECCGFRLLMPPLLGPEATSAHVKRAILQLARQRTEQDFLLLYFAGHGHPMTVGGDQHDIYLVTHDFDEQEVEESEDMHCSMRWLRDRLYIPTNTGKVLLVLDCCYAGNIGRAAPDPYLEDLRARIHTYFDAPGAASGSRPNGLRQALAATGHNQVAGEDGEHGRFTDLVLKALSGQVDEVIDLANHGYVNLRLLQNYLQRVMQGSQRSSLSGGDAGKDCILAQYEQRAEELRQLRRTQVNEQPSSYIPFNRIASFQPRPGEFEKVTRLLIPETSAEAHRPIVVGLVGMGGSGKTHLAVELAYTYKEAKRFPSGIFWLPVTEISQQGLARQLAGLAANALYLPPGDNVSHPENEENRARHLCRYLVTHPDALLILDNVDQIRQALDLLPHFAGEALRCTILYTSRSEDAPSYVQTYKVEGLTEDGALRLLLERRQKLLTHVLTNHHSTEAQAAHAICQHVERLPLALTLLRDLLQDEHLTLELLWREQQQRGIFDITSNEPDILKARLFRTFEQSWQKVETDDAQRLFLLTSHFPEAIPLPLWILSIMAGLPGNNTSLNRLGKARRELQRWSLIEVLPNDAIRLHPLLREFGSYQLWHRADGLELCAQASKRLSDEFININRLEQRARAKGYWNCLADVQEVLNYASLANFDAIDLLARIECWLACDSSLLGDNTWWPDRFPGLFHQQLYNRAVEEGLSLPGNFPFATDAPWLRQTQPAGAREQLLLRELRHPASVMSVAFSPNNHQLATGCENGIAYIWDVASGRMLQQLRGHAGSIAKVVFSPDGRTLVTTSDEGTAHVWHIDSEQALLVFREHTLVILSAAFSPDGKCVATASKDGTTRVWNVDTGEVMAFLAQHGEMMDVIFSPNGQLLATYISKQGDTDKSPFMHTLLIWDIKREEILGTIDLGRRSDLFQPEMLIAFSPDSRYLLWRRRDSAHISYGDVTGRIMNEGAFAELTNKTLSDLITSSLGTYFAVQTSSVELWQSYPRIYWHRYRHNDPITDVALSSDNTKVATVSLDRTAKIWAIPSTPQQERNLPEDMTGIVVHMRFSDDGSRLIRVTFNVSTTLWEVATGKSSWSVSVPKEDTKRIYGQEKIYYVLNALTLLDVNREFPYEFVEARLGLLLNVAFSPDGEIMVANVKIEEFERRMYIWHVYEKKLLGTLEGEQGLIRYVLFSPDGEWVFTGPHGNDVFIWDLHNYQHIGTLPGHLGEAVCIAVSDSMLVASGAIDGTIYLWSWRDRKKLATLSGHNQYIECLSFSGDNRLLFCADSSGQALLWRVDIPSQPVLAGVYSTPFVVKAVHWFDARRLVLADAGGEQSPPHFYHLTLEGDWDQQP